MSAGQKERVAGSMVRLMLATGKYKDYLTDLMELEVKRLGTEQEALLFRENSIGSKSIESFLKLGTVSIPISNIIFSVKVWSNQGSTDL